MDNNDLTRFSSCMAAMYEYYDKHCSEAIIGLYWQGLKQFDIAAIEQAIGNHLQNPESGQFLPKIADIVKMIGGTTTDIAIVAWSKVDKAIREKGTYADVVFDDELIHRVIYDMGGWIKLGEKDEDEWPFVAKEFQTRYRGYKSRNETPSYPKVLRGIANASNSQHGFKEEKAILIGSKDKCLAVLNKGSDKPMIEYSVADLAKQVTNKKLLVAS